MEVANDKYETAVVKGENDVAQKVASAETSGRTRRERGYSKTWLILIILSVALSLAVPFLLGGLEQFKNLKHLSWEIISLLTLLMLISWFFNAVRTRMLMQASGRQVGFTQAFLVTMAAEFAGVTTPASVGMAATYTFLFRDLGVRLGEAVGLVSLIVVSDLAFFGTTIPLAVAGQMLEGVSHADTIELVLVMLAVVGGGSIFLWLVVCYYRRIYHFLSRQMAKVQWLARYRYRLARRTVEFIHSMRILSQMSWWWRILLYLVTLGFWLPRYLVLVVAIYAVGTKIPFTYIYLVQGALNLGGQVLIMPGGGGTVDAGYAAFMSVYMPASTIAFTLLVWRVFTFYWYLIAGGPIFLIKTGEAARDLLSRKNK